MGSRLRSKDVSTKVVFGCILPRLSTPPQPVVDRAVLFIGFDAATHMSAMEPHPEERLTYPAAHSAQ
eukprot:CAMPEP_0184382242 /NCGR_PEP_ID=MMETSP0007-20130409/6179_1 /TAXON_ID=97485 /ORGANISM="Prymnesium parvum, Strain Texoma1" /LENGTH=66 /DNA_ID=CAMNT_0026728203 /DNA_START=219 /DNA_END=419 /DNA_ORIENTATION=-